MVMKYYITERSPYELFEGERGGRINFAGWSLNRDILFASVVLNSQGQCVPDGNFTFHVTDQIAKILLLVLKNAKSEPQKLTTISPEPRELFPTFGQATVKGMQTITVEKQSSPEMEEDILAKARELFLPLIGPPSYTKKKEHESI